MQTTTNVMKTIIVFGDVTGWEKREVLSHTSTPETTPVKLNETHTYANVEVGPVSLLGAVVQETVVDDTQMTVVYMGRDIPTWTKTALPADFGWTPDDFPKGITEHPAETDVLLLAFDDTARIAGWSKTMWLPSVPRPMERIALAADINGDTFLNVRVLEAGVDTTSPGIGLPYIVVVADTPEDVTAINPSATLWEPQDWCNSRRATWWSLFGLTQSLEVHSIPLMNTSIVKDVEIHDLVNLDADAIPLLPRDVRDGLERSLLDIA